MSVKKHDASAGRAWDNIDNKEDKTRSEVIGAVDNGDKCQEEAGTRQDGVKECPADEVSVTEEIEAARREAEEYKNEAARARADFYNYRTRIERDRARDRILAAEGAVDALLPVLDNLERALGAAQDRDSAIYKGVSMVRKQFFSALQGLGLKAIEASGQFDPALHEAVMAEDVENDEENGMILGQIHAGYMLGDKVLRAAQVKVGRKKS
jgi:molecular chaperone GrpE